MNTTSARLMWAVTAAAALSLVGTAARAQQPAAQAVPLRIAYVNSQAILANTPGRAQAESTFAREMTGFRAEVQRLQAELDSALQAYQRTEVALTPQARTQRQNELRQLEQRNRQRAQEIEQQASQREQELIAPILQRINAVIEGIRAEFNYHIIFDVAAQNSNIVTADRSLDISQLVVQRLQAGGAPPQAAPPAAQPAPAATDTTRARPSLTPPRGRRPQ